MDYLEVISPIVKKVGVMVEKEYNSIKTEFKEKGKSDYITKIDTEVEKEIREYLKKHYPEHGVLGEELGSDRIDSEYVWIIDPVDGTTNFIHKIPYFCTAIALKYKKETIFSVIYNPMTKELFHAEKGVGTFLNGRKLEIKEPKESHNWFMGFCCPDSTKNEEAEKIVYETFYHSVLRLTKLGSASLEFSYVADGRIDAYVSIGLKEWDILPGKLIVEEAGGIVEEAELIGKKIIISGHKEAVNKIKGLILPHEHYDEPNIF